MAKAAVQRKRITSHAPEHDHDADWEALLSACAKSFSAHGGQPVFCTDAVGLNTAFLDGVGAERKIHDCYHCRRFIETFGGLVSISDDGYTTPVFWDAESAPEFYRVAITKMAKIVTKARVTGPLLSSDKNWGMPATGTWTHFGIRSPSVYQRHLLTAGQAMASKREDHHTVARALGEYTAPMIAEAIRLFDAEHLSRAEKFTGPLHWLADLHAKRAAAKDARLRDNVLWRAIATAPDGFCHPKSSVLGPLLDAIALGEPFASIKSKFEAMTHALLYQRPQAAPKAQTIAQAEKIVAELGISRSLERRFARLDEIETVWRPATPEEHKPTGGVFGHLKPKGASEVEPVDAPASVMTWEKFARVVLPGAENIECYVSGVMNLIAMTTALHDDTPNIMKWDNPFAWYVYHGGSPVSQWGLSNGWVNVNAISAQPTMWGDNPHPHLGEGFMLILDGCVDSRTGQGNALFPECLRGNLHGVRATIEAYSRNAEMKGRESGSACGLDIRKGSKNLGYRLRVKSCGAWTDYKLDRWD